MNKNNKENILYAFGKFIFFNLLILIILFVTYFFFFKFSLDRVYLYFQIPLIIKFLLDATIFTVEAQETALFIESQYDRNPYERRLNKSSGFDISELREHQLKVNRHYEQIQLEKQRKKILNYQKRKNKEEIESNFKETGFRETNAQRLSRQSEQRREVEKRHQLELEKNENSKKYGVWESNSERELRLSKEKIASEREKFRKEYEKYESNSRNFKVLTCNACGWAPNFNGECGCTD